MSLPTALALLALLVAVFAVVAVFAIYTRLRLLERTALNPRSALLADEASSAPAVLLPREGDRATLVLLLNAGCPTCGSVVEAITEHEAFDRLAGVRLVAVFPVAAAVDAYGGPPGLERIADADVWAALNEGYAPCLYVIGQDGRISQRRFVYNDTDISALLSAIVPMNSGSPHAV